MRGRPGHLAPQRRCPTGSDPGKEKRKVDAEVDQLKNRLDETSADLSAAYTALQTTQNKLPAARTVLEAAQNAAAAADRANSVAAQKRLEAAQASEKKAEDEAGLHRRQGGREQPHPGGPVRRPDLPGAGLRPARHGPVEHATRSSSPTGSPWSTP